MDHAARRHPGELIDYQLRELHFLLRESGAVHLMDFYKSGEGAVARSFVGFSHRPSLTTRRVCGNTPCEINLDPIFVHS